MTTGDGYHHGDLRRQLLAAAVDAIGDGGVASVSLRDLARQAGVSHAAPAHHFTNKTGLLTALATQGFTLLADALAAADSDLAEMGVAYVRFALDHPAHFRVMFDSDVLNNDDPELTAARAAARTQLHAGVGALSDANPLAPLAAWSLAHGFATLRLDGNLAGEGDPAAVFRTLTTMIFTGSTPRQPDAGR
ncbi:MAG TPA: TetR/AcrR family transcriptional regulator [Pseudonocardiaceae bacterium]